MARMIFLIAVLMTLCSNALFAQCSDAGVCVIGSTQTVLGHQVGASYVFGKSGKTDDITFHAIHIEGGIQLFRDSRITILLPWVRASGPLGYASGIGDLTILWNQAVLDMLGDQLRVQIGGK